MPCLYDEKRALEIIITGTTVAIAIIAMTTTLTLSLPALLEGLPVKYLCIHCDHTSHVSA